MPLRHWLMAMLILLLTSPKSWAQFNMLPVTIDRDGIIVVVAGEIHCLRARPDEFVRWANRSIPQFPQSDKVSMATLLGATAIPNQHGECFLLLGKQYPTADEKGRVIISDKPDTRSRWNVTKIGGYTHGDGDKIKIYVIANAAVAGPKKYIALNKKPLVLKDQQGKEHPFLPFILGTEEDAAHFFINDYSGK